jgi:hypothetical protein
VTDVSVFYFVRRKGPDGAESVSKRRATLETIKEQGTAIMQSRRVVDHTDVDANGFLIGGSADESRPGEELWSRIRSLESRAKSRTNEALEIADFASGRKTVLLLESLALRKEAQALRSRVEPITAASEGEAAPAGAIAAPF